MKIFIIKATENTKTFENDNGVKIIGKVVHNFHSHALGFITGYVEVETSYHPLISAAFFIFPGTLSLDDVEEVTPKPLDQVLAEAKERSLE